MTPRITKRDIKRIQTSKERHGEDVFRNAGYKTAEKRWGYKRDNEGKKEETQDGQRT